MSQTASRPTAQVDHNTRHTNDTPPYEVVVVEEDEDNRNAEQELDDTRSDYGEVSVRNNPRPSSQIRLPPQTPGRVALLDLIANPESSALHAPAATPFEQVTWKHVPGFLESPSSSIRTTQRTKKRSYSSSPSSSQAQNRKSKHFRGEDNGSIVNQKTTKRTSPIREDPVSMLWNLYADTRVYEPALPPLPAFERSPQTPSQHASETSQNRKDSIFRRVASCGSEWPTSHTKRRKLDQIDPHSTTKQIFAARKKEMLHHGVPRNSKVNILLESVQQSLAACPPDHDGLSSSAPVPERSEAGEDDPLDEAPWGSSPSAEPTRPPPTASARFPQRQPAIPPGSSPLKSKANNLSDYDDVDFDDNDLGAIERASVQSQTRPLPLTTDTATRNLQRQGATDDQPTVQQDATNEFDDFDDFDDDDDIFNDELKLLAEKMDSQSATTHNDKSATTSKQPHLAGLVDGAFDDNDIDDALLQDLDFQLPPDQPTTKNISEKNHTHSKAIKRYLILDVLETTYDAHLGRKYPEKLLSIKDEKTKLLRTVRLRQSWYDTRCLAGHFVHLIGQFDHVGQCVVDDNQNTIILHPDHLISATVIGDAITCLRRAVLQDRIKATSPPAKPQVYGHMLHEVFGEALRLNAWDWDTFGKIIDGLLPTYLESLYEIEMSLVETKEYLMSKVPLMRAWAELFVSASFKADAVLRDRKGSFIPTAINKLLEIEEHIWSPMYGLKGNVDATVQALVQLPRDALPKTIIAPLELKTGKKDNNEAHRAQTALYTLLLSDRYDVDVTSGILYYMETSKTFRIEGIRNEIRQMIIWRNLLAGYVHDKLELPPMIKKDHLCKRCYAQTSCFTYHKLVEGGDGQTSGLKEIFEDAVAHLQPQHQDFFKEWDELLTKEERDCMKFRRELWTMCSTEREQVGRCFGNIVIEPGSAVENTSGPKINRFVYSFTKSDLQPGFSFTESQISVGEPIVVSDEQGHFALANGYVTNIRPRRITVAVDRRLQNARRRTKNFNGENHQSFVGIMEVSMEGVSASAPLDEDNAMLYRLDKDEFSNGMATVRNNLIRLMEHDLFRVRELRELIIEKSAPRFKPSSTAYSLSGPASQQNINVDQRAAIEKVMCAKDYALVLGMPGTGKTTTIAHIIRALVSQGKSVLLTSYTHTAVDNILLKIKDDKIPVLRLGSLGKIHPEVQSFADLGGVSKRSIEELERSWTSSKVVATTCLSINHGIFNHRIFDYCIVDEASQITLPVCLGPIRMAHTFILVGDHYQLPPLVQNKEAQEGGLDISLFKLLSDAQPSSVVNLEHQYRMAEDIMLLSNELIYSGRLKCGTPAVASRILTIPNLQGALEAHHHHSHRATTSSSGSASSQKLCTPSKANCYLRVALLPTSRTVFLNTDTISSPTSAAEVLVGSNQRITNPTESLLTARLLATLIRAGVPPKSIGVITFYRSQLAILRHEVKAVAGSAAVSDVEMHTADKYQGRDKEVILLSCVRSNDVNSVGELLKDWRRVNVAVTRARSKLIIIGSRSTLEGSGVPVLEGLIRIVSHKRWIVNLPCDAASNDGGHKFETVVPTQTQIPQLLVQAESAVTVVPDLDQIKADDEEQHRPVDSSITKSSLPPTGRKPLRSISANRKNHSENVNRTNGNVPNSAKIHAPFKRPKIVKNRENLQPQKVVQGVVNAENLLDKRPVLRDIVNELVPHGRYQSVERDDVNVDMTGFDENDFDDDLMLLDF